MVLLHQLDDFADQSFSTGKIISHSEATPGFTAILKKRATDILRHGHINTEIKCFIHRHSFQPGLDGPGRQYPTASPGD